MIQTANVGSIEVEARVTVSDETAERCLRLLEIWQNDHMDKRIFAEQKATESGYYMEFTIVDAPKLP